MITAKRQSEHKAKVRYDDGGRMHPATNAHIPCTQVSLQIIKIPGKTGQFPGSAKMCSIDAAQLVLNWSSGFKIGL